MLCSIDINFPELFLDGSHVTSAMQINNVMGVTIGPGGYLLNFTTYGIQINAGHEVMVDRCWLGETNFDFDFQKFGAVPNATAIEINGNDHYVLNTIVFSSRVGVAVHGAADYITGTHGKTMAAQPHLHTSTATPVHLHSHTFTTQTRAERMRGREAATERERG